MNKPVIGIVAGYISDGPGLPHARINQFYYDSILSAGGLPIILPPITDESAMQDYFDIVDGVLFPGGRDIDPARYGDPRHERVRTLVPLLESFILRMFELADARPELPTLGICLGCQVFNVGRGGALHQHIPDVPRGDAVEHSAYQEVYNGSLRAHPVEVRAGSRLAEVLGRTSLEVNSSHHQAADAKRLGRGLVASAFGPDGIVEALEDPGRPFFLAVQWHPEEIAAARPEHAILFRRFVQAASRRRESVAAE